MSTHSAPGDPEEGESGVDHSGPERSPRWTRLFTRPWFWVLSLGALWSLPLIKSLSVDFPEPVPGFERPAEHFDLLEEGGRRVRCADLAGQILIVEALDFGSFEAAEADLVDFRVRKKRWRGLGSLVTYVLLVQGGEHDALSDFLTRKTARKPNNLFLRDEQGALLSELRRAAGRPDAQSIVLDRHGRLRGAYGATEAEGDRMARDLASLANWEASDPELGQAVTH